MAIVGVKGDQMEVYTVHKSMCERAVCACVVCACVVCACES